MAMWVKESLESVSILQLFLVWNCQSSKQGPTQRRAQVELSVSDVVSLRHRHRFKLVQTIFLVTALYYTVDWFFSYFLLCNAFMSFHWAPSTKSMSFFCWESSPGPSILDLSPQGWTKKELLFELLDTLCLMQPWRLLAAFAARAHCCLMGGLVFTRNPRSLLCICPHTSAPPQHILVHEVVT